MSSSSVGWNRNPGGSCDVAAACAADIISIDEIDLFDPLLNL
jgi:hypothetical protein